jgi:hypothetical protein
MRREKTMLCIPASMTGLKIRVTNSTSAEMKRSRLVITYHLAYARKG